MYLGALALGPAKVSDIAKAAEIKRTTVYPVIESLKQKGLMSLEVKGFKQLFVAEHPDKLDSMLELRKKELQDNFPALLGMYNLAGTESSIKYYEGE